MKNRLECIGIIVFCHNASQKTLSGMFTILIWKCQLQEVKPKKLRCEICARIFETPEMLELSHVLGT